MLNLRQEIDNTENLKNKIKIAKNNINNAIVRGGGKHSNTLEEMPNNINNLIKNYKKIAMGTVNFTQQIKNGDIRFPVNINFSPSIFIVKIKPGSLPGTASYNLNSKDGQVEYVVNLDRANVFIRTYFQNGEGVVNITNGVYYADYTIINWIAIE